MRVLICREADNPICAQRGGREDVLGWSTGEHAGLGHTQSGNSHVRLRSPVQKCDAGHTGRVAAFRAERQDSADQAAGL